MIQTRVYYPADPVKFRRNFQDKFLQYSDRVTHYNAEEDGMLIYHVIHATVIVQKPTNDGGRINVTANISSIPGEIENAVALLEEVSEVKLVERDDIIFADRFRSGSMGNGADLSRHMEK